MVVDHDNFDEGDVDFAIESIEEPDEAPGSFMAYVATTEDEPGPWGGVEWQGPAFDAEVSLPQLGAVFPRGRSSRYSFFGERQMSPEGELDVVLSDVGGEAATLRVSPEAEQYLTEDAAVLVEPEFLGRANWRLRGARVEFVPDPAQDPWTSDIWLPVARIHRPARAGCTGRYTLLTSDATSYEAGFAIGGLGAKERLTFTVDFERTYPAKASCKEACVRAKVTIIFGTTYVGGKPFVYGTRVRVWGVDKNNRAYRDIPPAFDRCGWHESQVPAVGKTIDHLRNATGDEGDALRDKTSIDEKVAATMSLGVEFAGTPVTLSVAYTRTCRHKTSLEAQFMPGADYLGYLPRVDNPLEKCWTVLNS